MKPPDKRILPALPMPNSAPSTPVCLRLLVSLAAVTASIFAQQKISTTSSSVALNTPQFLWFTSQNALRFGTVSNTAPWSTANLGVYSLAFGQDAEAPGAGSFAFGQGASATGQNSFVFGPSAHASHFSIAMGQSAYADVSSIVLGENGNADSGGTQLGGSGMAIAPGAISLGESFAVAPYSFSAVYCGGAYGFGSIGIGVESCAEGDYSVSLGAGACAKAWGGIALGMGNVAKRKNGAAIDSENPASDDAIFEVARPDPALGIDPAGGMPPERGENALTIYRDGDIHAVGAVRVPQRGNLSMGAFQAKPAGVAYP